MKKKKNNENQIGFELENLFILENTLENMIETKQEVKVVVPLNREISLSDLDSELNTADLEIVNFDIDSEIKLFLTGGIEIEMQFLRGKNMDQLLRKVFNLINEYATL